jgi:1-acyl-sn-glycerol-3-phosphate acyltransferase
MTPIVDDWKLEPAHDHGLPLGKRLKSLRRENGLVSSAAHQAWWTLVRAFLAVYHRFEVRGRENIPREPPFIIVANHESHLDALALASVLPWRIRDRVFPIAAGDTFFETPVLTAFAAFAMNALPMWRRNCGPHALEELRKRLLEEPCAYILFPEGTRSRDGEIHSFKPGIGMIVAGTDVPVVPCRLEGPFEACPPDSRVPRPRKLTLSIGTPLRFAATPAERAGWKEVAERLEEAVRGLG